MSTMTTAEARDTIERLMRGIGGTVAIVGSLNADYMVTCERLPGPGVTVTGGGLRVMPGGKSANQAACAARLGADVRMVGAVGSDQAADFLVEELAHAGVSTDHVERLDGPSGTAVVEVDARGENSIVVSPGSNGLVDASFVRAHRAALDGASVLGLCFEIPMDGVVEAARIAHERGVRVLVNNSPFLADLPEELVACTDVLLLNEHELADMLGIGEGHTGDGPDWKSIAQMMVERGYPATIVTLGAKGSVVLDGLDVRHIAPLSVKAVDTTGCGDAYMGAVLAGLASGYTLADAAAVASYVSAYAATGQGAQSSYGTAEEILAAIASL